MSTIHIQNAKPINLPKKKPLHFEIDLAPKQRLLQLRMIGPELWKSLNNTLKPPDLPFHNFNASKSVAGHSWTT